MVQLQLPGADGTLIAHTIRLDAVDFVNRTLTDARRDHTAGLDSQLVRCEPRFLLTMAARWP